MHLPLTLILSKKNPSMFVPLLEISVRWICVVVTLERLLTYNSESTLTLPLLMRTGKIKNRNVPFATK